MTPLTIAVLGSGPVGRALAGAFSGLGHAVVLGTRDPATTTARPEHASWSTDHPTVRTSTFADAVVGCDLVVNASGGDVTLAVLGLADLDRLDGTVLLDVSNPLDHSQGFPPRLSVSNDDSLGEQVQRAHPRLRVVKSLNTMNNAVMADPRRLGSSTTVFVSGDDADAKALVTDLLTALGHDDVVDLGDITTARGPEMWLALWVRTAVALGTSDFNLKVVRA
ncbi:NADPH-dependent F420 reductase [Nocardioides sp.]|uniref:NADPH-dependent F420 reductase n=1 Tax=Nocardioides sp. TaxID=35761 RepID=UPI00272555F6|nr:NAD(P)-binding domain-containing protein [Nocardioides sp.]MDO9455163.1 NAD(P)-binding domain-containing protein [Nocardioides sp.]